jgi:hypothetical protein
MAAEGSTSNDGPDNEAAMMMSTTASSKDDDKKKKTTKKAQQASTSETLSFVFTSGTKTTVLFFCGILGGIGNGVVSV